MFFPRAVDVGCVVVVLLAAECWLLVAGLAAGRNQPTPLVEEVGLHLTQCVSRKKTCS